MIVVVAAGKPAVVPVIVNVNVPGCALFEAVSVSVELVPVVTVDGLKFAVTPLPNPLIDSATGPVKLPLRATVIAKVELVFRCSEPVDGLADTENDPAAVTVNVTVVVRVRLSLTPVTVTV